MDSKEASRFAAQWANDWNSHDLEAFAAVVETGSIVGASKRLHLTQPPRARADSRLRRRSAEADRSTNRG